MDAADTVNPSPPDRPPIYSPRYFSRARDTRDALDREMPSRFEAALPDVGQEVALSTSEPGIIGLCIVVVYVNSLSMWRILMRVSRFGRGRSMLLMSLCRPRVVTYIGSSVYRMRTSEYFCRRRAITRSPRNGCILIWRQTILRLKFSALKRWGLSAGITSKNVDFNSGSSEIPGKMNSVFWRLIFLSCWPRWSRGILNRGCLGVRAEKKRSVVSSWRGLRERRAPAGTGFAALTPAQSPRILGATWRIRFLLQSLGRLVLAGRIQ